MAEAGNLGGADAWFAGQLSPGSIVEPAVTAMRGWYPYLDATAEQLYDINAAGTYPAWQSTMDLGRWTIMRRTYSRGQLFEQMVEFWSNLLHVPLYEDNSWPHRQGYDKVIRTHALGTYTDMLYAATVHGAMGCFLNNAVSTKYQVNENLGRELLELHTVGVDAHYSEAEVLSSARIITGWHVDMWNTWQSSYRSADHWTGPVSVLGFSDDNAAADGRGLTRRYLAYLARHPLTAQRIARRLCVRFVSDNPSAGLVDTVAAAYRSSGTDITATLQALYEHPDFAESAGDKVRTPAEDAIAGYRLLGAEAQPPSSDNDFARAVGWQLESLGQKPFGWPQPDGFPDTALAWSTVGRVLGSLDLHLTLAGGWWPSAGVVYPTLAERMPALPARFDAIVDYASRQVLQRKATPVLQTACQQMLELAPDRVFTGEADFGEWRMVQLLATVLNTPAHASR